MDRFNIDGFSSPINLDDIDKLYKLKDLILETPDNNTDVVKRKFGLLDGAIFCRPLYDVIADKNIVNILNKHYSKDLLCITGQILYKKPGIYGLPHNWHIDWGNKINNVAQISVAVTDLKSNNSCINVIPGTHKYDMDLNHLRKISPELKLDMSNRNDMVKLMDHLYPNEAPHYYKELIMKSGEFIMMHNSLFHGVPETKEDRISLVCRYINPDIHYEREGLRMAAVPVVGDYSSTKNIVYKIPSKLYEESLIDNYRYNKSNNRAIKNNLLRF